MAVKEYKDPLAQLRASLREKKQQRSALDEEIKKLEEIVEGLSELATEDAGEGIFARLDAEILKVFAEDRVHKLSPRQVTARLLKKGVDMSGFSNRAAYVHSSLKRLVKKEKIDTVKTEDSGSLYWWKSDTQSKVAEIAPSRAAQ